MKKFFIFSMLCLLIAFGFAPKTQAQSECVITSLPFTEGFEGVNSGLPPCFTRNPLGIYQVNNNPQPYVSAYQPHNGSNALRSFNTIYSDTSAHVPTLVFPELDSQFSMTSMVLEFWAKSLWGTFPYFVVGVMDDPDDFSTFTEVQTLNFAAENQYEKFTIYFSQYSGYGHHIAIKIANVPPEHPGQVFIDDIILDQMTACLPVLNLAVNNYFGSEVTINWTPNALGDAGTYNVTLQDMDQDAQVTSVITSDTFYTFTNLNPSTHYRAYVEAICSAGLLSPADSVDFTTGSPSAGFPYFEDFEGDADLAMSVFTLQGDGPNQWVYGSAAGLPGEDNPTGTGHSLYISPDSGATNIYVNTITDAYAVFTADFPANNDMEYRLSFDYRAVGEASDWMAYDFFSVYMMNAGVDLPASGAPAGTPILFEAANHSDWTHVNVILNNVAGSSKQFVFYWYNNGWNLYGDSHLAAAVDNIRISGSDCAQPNGLYANNIEQTSATLNWNETGNATNWTVYYRLSGSDTAYTTLTVANDTFVDITGLLGNTDYEFYVVADCGTSESEPSDLVIFRTACDVVSQLPYIEDFESGIYTSATQQDYISCWERYSSDPDHYPYISSDDWNAHGGYHFLDFHYTPNCFDIAIMPELDASINAADLMISFYTCHSYYGYWGSLGTLEVGVMTDPTDSSSFVVIDTIDISSADVYTYVGQMVSFGSYTGNGKYIAFRVSNCDQCGYYIDDLMLEERPACMYPNAFNVVNISNDSVTLAWNELGNATTWNIQYGNPGFSPEDGTGTQVIVNNNPCTIGGLSNFTSYDFYLQANCGESVSDWVGPISVVTGVTNIGTIGSDSMTTCNAIICDNGGYDGDYASYCDYMMVVYPATAGSGLQITGTTNLSGGQYSSGESHLYFHDGVGTAAPLIADITGVNSNLEVAASGPITIHFTSAYYTGPGFMLNVSCATCTPPSNFTASNIQNDEITLSWSGNADQYAIYMSGDATGYFTTTNNSIVINNLNSNSDYTFQVRSLCGSDSSLLTPALNVSTLCDAITITTATPWTENFEGYAGSGNQPFVCWSRPVVDATYGSPFVYCGWAPSCHSGVNSAELKGSSAMLVLPVFSNDVHELRLSFWATSTEPTTGTLEVGVMTDFNDPSTFEYVGTCGEPGPRGSGNDSLNGNYMGPFDFSNVVATNGRIALRYTNSSSWNSWNLDDFTVEIIPANCPMPTGLTVTNITQTSATATWTAGGDETAWKLQYKQAGTSDWGSEISVTTNSYDITGLTAETVYQVRVKADCGDGAMSGWTTPYDFFTTPLPVIQPTVVTYAATDITETAGTMNGAITDEGNQTIILKGFEWKLASDNDFTPVVTLTGNTLTYTLTGLTPNTCVNYRAYATTPNGTVYGETMTFCTNGDTPEPCETPTDLVATDVTSNSITINWTDHSDSYNWKIAWTWESTLTGPVHTSNKPYTLENLQPNTTYTIRVQTICAGIGESDWSEPLTVTTLGVGIDDHLLNNISLYPNPAKEYIDVRVDEFNVTSMEVYDVYGKLINTINVIDNPTRINVSNLASGMYFVRVTTEQGVATKSFVKK